MKSDLLTNANGFFAFELCFRMEKRGLTVRDVAAEVGCTPEQIRKVARGEAVPSDILAKVLYRTVGIDPKVGARKIQIDRLRRRFGPILWEAFDKIPEMEPLYIRLPYLTQEQRDDLLERMEAQVEANKIVARRRAKSQQSRQSQHCPDVRRKASRHFSQQ